MTVLLPMEMIQHIVGYLADLDIRREYGVYSKVRIPDEIKRRPGLVRRWDIREKVPGRIALIAELNNKVPRVHDPINCDAIHVTLYFDNPDFVKYEISIAILRPKSPHYTKHDCDFIVPAQLRDRYQWITIMYDYTRYRKLAKRVVSNDGKYQTYMGAKGIH
jgi:hypothetical protein